MDAPRTPDVTPDAAAADVLGALSSLEINSDSRVVVGLRSGEEDDALRLALAELGATVLDVDPSLAREEGEARLARANPTHVIADTMLYVAGVRSPLRGYLRRRGFVVPNLGAVDAVHVHVGRRWPLLVPRSPNLRQLVAGYAAS